ncbi:MAG: M20/M25/M40 family metallo-hydrolase [Chloroflexota bacterium]
MRVKGKAAHAGVEIEKGANAILELAHQIIAFHRLHGLAPGVTVSAGLIKGGTLYNVVPAEAWVEIDVRAETQAGVEALRQAVTGQAGHTTVPGTQVHLEGDLHYPPMTTTPATTFLVDLARRAAGELGFEIKGAATGGASDANLIAGLGLPVLDGLGPVGGLDHSPDEYIEQASIVPRTAMLVGLIQHILAEREHLITWRDQGTVSFGTL